MQPTETNPVALAESNAQTRRKWISALRLELAQPVIDRRRFLPARARAQADQG